MQRRAFLRTSCGIVGSALIASRPAFSAIQARREQTRRILYVLGQFSQATPKSMQGAVETIGRSGFNVVVLSFLQASVNGEKLTLLYNGNEVPLLSPEIPALLAKLRSGFGTRKRIMLSIGGWQETATFAAIRSFGIAAFVRQLTEQMIGPFGLGGIDLDLEPQKGGLDQWTAVHREYGEILVELTNEYKRVHPDHVVTHAPLSIVAAELYAKPAPLPGLSRGLLAATRGGKTNNINWLNLQFYEGGLIEGGDVGGFYRDSLAVPLIGMRSQTGISEPLHFFTPLFQPQAKQPLAFCQQTIRAIDTRCASLNAGSVDGVALWDYRQVAHAIDDWSTGLEAELHE
jgi:hypothetical protein